MNNPKATAKSESKEHQDKPSPDEPKEIQSVNIRTALYIGGIVLAALGTFFTTRLGLQDQINDLSARELATRKIVDEFLADDQLKAQINNIVFLEADLREVDSFVKDWKKPEFVYARQPPGGQPYPYDVIVGPQNVSYASIPLTFSSPLMNMPSELRSAFSKELMEDIIEASKLVHEYNRFFFSGNITYGYSKFLAEKFEKESETTISKLRQQLRNLHQKVIEERMKLEARLTELRSSTLD